MAEALVVYNVYIDKESTTGKAAAATSFTTVPEAAADLHATVSAFDDRNDPIIEGISGNPLQELLAESGYTTASSPPSTLADPTLPQNRPSQIPNSGPMEASSAIPEDQPNNTSNFNGQQERSDVGNLEPSLPSLPMTLETALLWHRYFTARSPNEQDLRRYVYLDYLEAEGETRGGPGRINYEEFMESVDAQGRGELEFVWRWIDMGLF